MTIVNSGLVAAVDAAIKDRNDKQQSEALELNTKIAELANYLDTLLNDAELKKAVGEYGALELYDSGMRLNGMNNMTYDITLSKMPQDREILGNSAGNKYGIWENIRTLHIYDNDAKTSRWLTVTAAVQAILDHGGTKESVMQAVASYLSNVSKQVGFNQEVPKGEAK